MEKKKFRDKFRTASVSRFTMKDKEKYSLHKILDQEAIVQAHEKFISYDGRVNSKQLERILIEIADIKYSNKVFDQLFLKMNINRDGLVTWDEFVSHLILGFKDEEVSTVYEALDPPISKAPRLLKSKHRHPLNRILFCPTVKPDRTANFTDGSYMTSSKDGCINYWSLDLQHERTVQSSCPELKVQPTWVTDMVALPDVSVVCTSSTERDLRFYDTSARKFELRVMFTSLEDAVCTLSYVYHQDINEESFMLMGDMGGSIRILYFSPIGRGPFKSKPGIPLLSTRYDAVVKGMVSGFRVVELKRVHEDAIKQIQFYHTLKSIISVAPCSKVSMSIKDDGGKTNYIFKVPKGFWSFTVEESQHMIATGGPDCIVRIWNPFVTARPNSTFLGHHAPICSLIFQEGGKKLCSISKDKCIKVWDTVAQVCLQTYTSLPSELGERTQLTVFYNPENRNIIIGSVMIVILSLCPLQSGEHTDGNTHSLAISKVLYNPLFKVIVTCGLDSLIIVWDPWNGRRISVVRDAHVRMLRGEEIPVEITAACFDPGNHLLLTGAHDGSLKMWNFNTGTCLRNMNIETNCEVTSVVWVKGRILAIGWNKHVTEFLESGEAVGPGGAFSKSWDTRHTEDVLSAVARVPQTLATGSYSGELLFWRLETGQPYKQFNVADPTKRIKIKYNKESKKKLATAATPEATDKITTTTRGRSGSLYRPKQAVSAFGGGGGGEPALQNVDKARARRLSVVQVPAELVPPKGLAVRCMLFLSSRPMIPNVGTLLISVETGYIQVWSHHPLSGYITKFSAVHVAGDYVMCMTSDTNNEFLFTGTTGGYVKTWLIKNFCILEHVEVFMPNYRIQFPFLWKDRIEGRAKRTHRGQLLPMLCNSYKAHRQLLTGIVYIEGAKIIVTSSADYTARLWTLGGQYLGTLGTFKPWNKIQVDTPVGTDHPHMMPPDIKRTASSTTYKVLMGGIYERPLTRKQRERLKERELTETDYSKGVYGVRVKEPILGNYFKLPPRETQVHDFTLDTSFSYIPVYQHLITPVPNEENLPRNPDDIRLGPDGKKAKDLLSPNISRIKL